MPAGASSHASDPHFPARRPRPPSSARFGWWAMLAFTHRWLGIAGCLLFLLWFVSGIAMIYVRMPALTSAERLERLAPIDAGAIRVTLAEGAAFAGVASTAPAQIAMLGSRPVYRFGGARPTTVFADHLEIFRGWSPDEALRIVRAFAPEHAATSSYAGRLSTPDQWTLQLRPHFPLHHVRLGDAAGSELYVSHTTGEVVMQTTRSERVWAYVGPVAHWLYVPVLRRNGPLWSQVVIWSSIAGCVLCLSGIIAGLVRFAPFRRFVIRRERTMSPYVGWLRWHHYAGLLFGVITLTWTFSGLLSMDPFPQLSSEGITDVQRRAVSGAVTPIETVTLAQGRAALDVARRALVPREMRLTTFRGGLYWIASESPMRQVLISATTPEAGARRAFDRAEIEAVAHAAAPGHVAVELTWLEDYDAYYYDRRRSRPLPVLRARYADAAGTWMYLDPSRGAIALVVRRPDRVNRWLYNGLHSLDFPWLYQRRPLWDVVLVTLSLGGIAGVVTSVVPALRRMRRHVRRLSTSPITSRPEQDVSRQIHEVSQP